MINSRRKGIEYERKKVRDLQSIGFKDAKRCIQGQKDMNSPDIIGVPFYAECKRGGKAVSMDGRWYSPSRYGELYEAYKERACRYFNNRDASETVNLPDVVIFIKLDHEPELVLIPARWVIAPVEGNFLMYPWDMFVERARQRYGLVSR